MCRCLISLRTLNSLISTKQNRTKFKTSVVNIRYYSYTTIGFTSSSNKCVLRLNLFGNHPLIHYSTSLTPSVGVSLSHVKHVLNMKNLEVKDGFTCLTTKCIFCNHAKNSIGDLFINKVTGYFLCTKCRANGSWDSLEKALKRDKIVLPSEELVMVLNDWSSISEKSISLQSLPEDKIQEVMKQFKLKEKCDEILFKLETLVNQNGTNICIPIKNGVQIVGVKELTSDGKETSVPNTGCKGVLTIKSKIHKKEAVLVESLKDLLVLGCLSLPYDIVCLPHGVNNIPLEILPVLEHYTKIILWFNNDDGNLESARHVARKLNDQRCYFVRPTDDHPGPYKADVVGLSIPDILNSAMPISHKFITHFSHLREDVLSYLQNNEKAAGVKWARFPTLNKILKGHRRGEMTIITGPSGSGKTTFMSEYSLDLAKQGVTTLWGSFEIKNERLAQTMLQQLCQFPLHLQLDKFNEWADRFESLPIYFMTFYGQQKLKTVMEAVEHAAYVYDISHVIIDNVQFMMGQLENDNSLDRFYRQDVLIGTFRNFATTANCHVTLVIHPRKEKDAEMLSVNSVFGGAKATQEADNVLIIQQKMLQSLKLKKFLQVAKNRYTGDLGVMPLEFNKDALSYAQKPSYKVND